MKLVVATCQFPVAAAIGANLAEIAGLMRQAHAAGAEVVHFPEGALSGYAGADFAGF